MHMKYASIPLRKQASQRFWWQTFGRRNPIKFLDFDGVHFGEHIPPVTSLVPQPNKLGKAKAPGFNIFKDPLVIPIAATGAEVTRRAVSGGKAEQQANTPANTKVVPKPPTPSNRPVTPPNGSPTPPPNQPPAAKPKGYRDPYGWAAGAALLSAMLGLGSPAAILAALGMYWYINSTNEKLKKNNTETTQ